MSASAVARIRRLPLFSKVDASIFGDMVSSGHFTCIPAGRTVLSQGEVPAFLHVLVDGRVAFVDRDAHQNLIASPVIPRPAFDLLEVIVDKGCLNATQTLDRSCLFMMPAGVVRDVFRRNTAFAGAVALELAHGCRTCGKELKKLRLRTGTERLANWILSQDRLAGGAGCFRIDRMKRVLASQLGMRPENLSRGFADLAGHGVVVNGPVIRIVDRQALLNFSRPIALLDDPEV